VRTDTAHASADAQAFILRGVAVSVALFGLFRLRWTELHVVMPLTQLQAQWAAATLGPPASPVVATLACSGADAMALCLGAVLAYPVPWRSRLVGVAGSIGLILALNTLRIGTLGQAAASPNVFSALHLFVWPVALSAAIGGYVFAWMRAAEGPGEERALRDSTRSRRFFVVLTLTFVAAFIVASPLFLANPHVLAVAALVARAAAVILRVLGIDAVATGNVLLTPHGGFLVTQECIVTPVIPVYLAAVGAFASSWRRLGVGLLTVVPLFFGLGILRLLVVAVPAIVSPAEFVVHAFFQLLLGVIAVGVASRWRHQGTAAAGYAAAGLLVGVLWAYVCGPSYSSLVQWLGGAPNTDPQGAIEFLPTFQVGLYLALWTAAGNAIGWRRAGVGLLILAATQVIGLLLLNALATHFQLLAHVRDIRGWAIVGPVLTFAAVVRCARPDP
jgi:exosortase/archaeosortase family protein